MREKHKEWGDRFIQKLEDICEWWFDGDETKKPHPLWPDCEGGFHYWQTLYKEAATRDERFPRDRAFDAVAATFASRAAQKVFLHYIDVRRKCESPIETAFFDALMIATHSYDLEAIYHGFPEDGVGVREFLLGQKPSTIFIVPQAPMGPYRVDFHIFSKPHVSPGGALVSDCRMVVECDGHDFHERTKQQAKRDRSRDRALTRDGYRVLRFTGSEVWANPFDCANETLEIFNRTIAAAARAR